GVEDDIRPDVWRYLLMLYPWTATEADRTAMLAAKEEDYDARKRQWQTLLLDAYAAEAADRRDSRSPAPAPARGAAPRGERASGDEREGGDVMAKLRERRLRVEKDVIRTDRGEPFFQDSDRPLSADALAEQTPLDVLDLPDGPRPLSPSLKRLRNVLVTYTTHNFELGYVQGMNDLLAPILDTLREESPSFWCFVQYMEHMQVVFSHDQLGMRRQLKQLELLIKLLDPPLYCHMERIDAINLFCCYRWFLVMFKRELNFEDTKRFWEAHWSCAVTRHLHIFVAFAILNAQRHALFQLTAFDECLKFINELSGKLDI
ncbi:hypothetical protein CXG81DRAFT_927, partial [Caulochytrium protostelioides]